MKDNSVFFGNGTFVKKEIKSLPGVAIHMSVFKDLHITSLTQAPLLTLGVTDAEDNPYSLGIFAEEHQNFHPIVQMYRENTEAVEIEVKAAIVEMLQLIGIYTGKVGDSHITFAMMDEDFQKTPDIMITSIMIASLQASLSVNRFDTEGHRDAGFISPAIDCCPSHATQHLGNSFTLLTNSDINISATPTQTCNSENVYENTIRNNGFLMRTAFNGIEYDMSVISLNVELNDAFIADHDVLIEETVDLLMRYFPILNAPGSKEAIVKATRVIEIVMMPPGSKPEAEEDEAVH